MAFTTSYVLNVKKDASLAAEKQWMVDVSYAPTAASVASSLLSTTPTVPGITTGPLGATGSVSAGYQHGDTTGTATGFASPLDAVQRALLVLENDRALNNT